MQRLPSLIALLLVAYSISAPISAQPQKPTQLFVPACNLHELNRAYVAALNRLHRQLNPNASLVQYDAGLLPGTVLHLVKMERADSVFHDALQAFKSAELCGTRYNLDSNDPAKIARYMLEEWSNSEPHCVIQADPQRVYVAIAVGPRYAVVRIAHVPIPSTKEERAAYVRLGIEP